MAGRILIVDDVATSRIVSKGKLTAACYHPVTAVTGQSCLDAIREARPDLVLLNVDLPDMPGLEVLKRLRADPQTCTIPVIMFDTRDDPAMRLAALIAGAEDCLHRPVPDVVLMARLRNLMRARQILDELGGRDAALPNLGIPSLGLAETAPPFAMRGKIVLVTECAEPGLRLRKSLSQHLGHEIRLMNQTEALSDSMLAEEGSATDLFVIDAEHLRLSEGGLRLMSELRARSVARHAGMVLIQRSASADEIALCYDMGANLVLPSTVPEPELAQRLGNLMLVKQTEDRTRHALRSQMRLSVIDPLTGLYNRRHALPRLAAIASRAHLTRACFAVMVIDLDRFKSVNDAYGHAAGDKVLIEVARRLTENLRMSDLVARMGGEEFLVALPDINLTEARRTAERLCQTIQSRPIPVREGVSLTITASIGVTLAQPDPGNTAPDAITTLIDHADRAMLAAKAEGRNQVIFRASAA